MAFKKDSWLVRGVLVLAVVGFVAVGVIGAFSGRSQSPADRANPASTQNIEDTISQLEGEISGYKAVLGREPNNETALLGIIQAQIQLAQLGKGDLADTVEPLERLTELNPDVQYAIALAQTKQQLEDLEGAAQVYRRVLTENPGNVQALEGLVALLLSQGRTEAAAGLLRDTLATADQTNELNPGSVDKLSVKLLLGQVLVEQESYGEALKLYDEAIADAQVASPTQPDFRPTLAKALVLQEQGKDSEAKPLFDQALALAPTQYKDSVQQLIDERTAPAQAAESSEPEGDADEDAEDASVEPEEAPVAP